MPRTLLSRDELILRANQRDRDRYAALRKAGLCVSCKAFTHRARCRKCQTKKNETRKAKIVAVAAMITTIVTKRDVLTIYPLGVTPWIRIRERKEHAKKDR